MKYADSGKRSRAWWLQAVKWFGKDGNKGIMRGAEVPTHQVKFAMEDLLDNGFISRTGGGRGKRDLAYHLTEAGGRYLDEHNDELEEKPSTTTTAAPGLGVQHSVPHVPEFPGARLTSPPADPATAEKPTPDKNILRHANSGVRTPLNTPENPEKTSKSAAAAPIYDPAIAQRAAFGQAFREILIEILLEKYADQVTAAEVMARLEGRI